MYRKAMEDLYQWKERKTRKPLIIRGARQVGKTWLMRNFAAKAYKDCIYVSFDNNPQMRDLFSADFDIRRLMMGLELYAAKKIDIANTLLIFDEIQEVPRALSSLKYFNEDAPNVQIICAGSLLGVALHPGTSFPVGKVEFLDLHPMSYLEFLMACGKGQFAELLMAGDKTDFSMITTFKQDYISLLKQYYFVGGMPEVVQHFSNNLDFNETSRIQERILLAYEQDFSKHAPHEAVPRLRMLWNSIPAQLTKENKKFRYSLVRDGARAKDYELALMWLSDCGLVHKVHRATMPSLPLKAYEDIKAFKLFLLDVGLLSRMVQLRQDVLLDGNNLFKEFKGALTEQYVLQQLKTIKGMEVFYWTNDKNTAEIDFLISTGSSIVPLEVKSEVNLQAKSLKVFREKFNPNLSVRSSMGDYNSHDGLTDLPLYAINTFSHISKIFKHCQPS